MTASAKYRQGSWPKITAYHLFLFGELEEEKPVSQDFKTSVIEPDSLSVSVSEVTSIQNEVTFVGAIVIICQL